MADATVNLRLDASQLQAGARLAGRSLDRLTGRGQAMAAGMRRATADTGRLASAATRVDQPRRGPRGSAALERAGFAGRPMREPPRSGIAQGHGFAMRDADRGVRTPGQARPGQVAGAGFAMRDAERGMRTPGRAGPGQIAGMGFVMRDTERAERATRRWGRSGARAGEQVAGGARGATEAMRRFRRSGERAAQAFGRAMDRAGASVERIAAQGGIPRLWSLQAAGTQVRMLARGLLQGAQATVDVAGERQTARAEVRTVVTDLSERRDVREAARGAALGRGGMVVPITESDFTTAVFRGVASGLTTERAINLVPAGANLALAGQTTAEVASTGLTDTGNVFRDRSFREIADIYARGQDIGTFPVGIQELFAATTKAASTAKAAGLTFEETVATTTFLSSLGPTFRGGTGGQKALMAIRELDLGGLQKIGMRAVRDETGAMDFPATLRMLADSGVSRQDLTQAVGKRAAPALLALVDGIERYENILGELDRAQGTAMDNAREHSNTYAASMQRLQARTELLQAELGEGAIKARQFGADMAVAGIDAMLALGERFPNLVENIGKGLQIGGVVAGGAGGFLETMVGVHALSQLMGGRVLQRLGGRFGALFRLLGRGAPLIAGTVAGIGGIGRRFGSLFAFMGRGIGLVVVSIGRAFGWMALQGMAAIAKIAARLLGLQLPGGGGAGGAAGRAIGGGAGAAGAGAAGAAGAGAGAGAAGAAGVTAAIVSAPVIAAAATVAGAVLASMQAAKDVDIAELRRQRVSGERERFTLWEHVKMGAAIAGEALFPKLAVGVPETAPSGEAPGVVQAPTADVAPEAAVADVAAVAPVAAEAPATAVAPTAAVAATAPAADAAPVAPVAAPAAEQELQGAAGRRARRRAAVAEAPAADVAPTAATAAVADVATDAAVADTAPAADIAPVAVTADVAATAPGAAVADMAPAADIAPTAATAAVADVAAVAPQPDAPDLATTVQAPPITVEGGAVSGDGPQSVGLLGRIANGIERLVRNDQQGGGGTQRRRARRAARRGDDAEPAPVTFDYGETLGAVDAL